MHLTLCFLLTLLFCFLFAVSAHFKDFETRAQKHLLALTSICGIIVGVIAICIAGLVTDKPVLAMIQMIIIIICAYVANHFRVKSTKSTIISS